MAKYRKFIPKLFIAVVVSFLFVLFRIQISIRANTSAFLSIDSYHSMVNNIAQKFSEPHHAPEAVNCDPGIPCQYPERVDFRIIVLTFNRSESLNRLLRSLNTVELDGDSGRLEIWIDRNDEEEVDTDTLEVAKGFSWNRGQKRVHVQKRHVGIYGQWIDTWSPSDNGRNSSEIAVFLEDDLVVSPFIYRWLKAAHGHYRGKPEFFAATLVSDEPRGKESRHRPMVNHTDETVFYHKYPDTWGLSPSPYQWHLFQQWFHRIYPHRTDFQPYVPGTIFTRWYKKFQKRGTAHHMWSMWVIYYTYSEQLFTLYNNIQLYSGKFDSCLSMNRREVGLHYFKGQKKKNETCSLLTEWKDSYVTFPENTLKTHFNGSIIEQYSIL